MALDVSNDKIKSIRLSPNDNCTAFRTKTVDVRAVCGFELSLIGASQALTRCWGNDGEQGASIDEILLIRKFVGHVQ